MRHRPVLAGDALSILCVNTIMTDKEGSFAGTDKTRDFALGYDGNDNFVHPGSEFFGHMLPFDSGLIFQEIENISADPIFTFGVLFD
jgi:hypothetical protein